jgi:Trk-type K+ transport system membrane component
VTAETLKTDHPEVTKAAKITMFYLCIDIVCVGGLSFLREQPFLAAGFETADDRLH